MAIIKLKSSGLTRSQANYLKDLHSTSYANPLSRERVLGDEGKEVAVSVKPHKKDGIRIMSIRTLHHEKPGDSYGKGHASSALKHLTHLADKHKIDLHLEASPYNGGLSNSRPKGSLNKLQLKKWYQRHGFTIIKDQYNDNMVRKYKP